MNGTVRLASILVFLALSTMPALATTITVNTFSSEIAIDGNCSVREAVQAANTNLAVDACPAGQSSGTDDIFIDLLGTVSVLPGAALIVTEQVQIRGRARGLTRLSGGNQRTILRVDMVDRDDEFVLSDLRMEDARGASIDPQFAGGAVQLVRGGGFVFTRVDFEGNLAAFSAGGAIHVGPLTGASDAFLTIEQSRFLRNAAEKAGGAIAGLGVGSVDALRRVTITASEFLDNTSAQDVSALSLSGVETITIESSQFSNNVSQDDDPAVRITGASRRSLLIVRETGFLTNIGTGLQLDNSDALISNSTFFGNDQQADGTFGGGLQVQQNSFASVLFSTIVENADDTGGQILVCATCEMIMRSSVVWSESGLAEDCVVDDIGTSAGEYTSQGQNIDATATCATAATDLPMTDPKLLALGVYGPQLLPYQIRTLPPQASSPVVDLGPSDTCPGFFGAALTVDQRGFARPLDGDGDAVDECDSGSIEYQPGDDPGEFELGVTFLGNGDGRVVSSPAGLDCVSNCSASFLEGSQVTLEATPDTGNSFSGWSGACTGMNDCSVGMNQAQNVTASFVVDEFQLTINVMGSGEVDSTPAGIACPGDCNQPYPSGTIVTLTASAASGFEFAGWSGGGCSGINPCQVVMSQAKNVTATFVPLELELTVTVAGNGSVDSAPSGIDCPDDCTQSYPSGTSVILTAVPQPGFVFDGWSGDCTGSGICQLTIVDSRDVTASFSAADLTLDVSLDGTGTGTIISNPAGINCPGDCSESFQQAQLVTLTATPDADQFFQNWAGDCSGTGACTITVDQNAVVIGVFGDGGAIFLDGFE